MSTSRLTRATSGTVLSDNVYMTPSVFSPAAETTSSGVPSFSPGSSPFNHLEISPYGDSTIYRHSSSTRQDRLSYTGLSEPDATGDFFSAGLESAASDSPVTELASPRGGAMIDPDWTRQTDVSRPSDGSQPTSQWHDRMDYFQDEALTALNHITNIVRAASERCPELLSGENGNALNGLLGARQQLIGWLQSKAIPIGSSDGISITGMAEAPIQSGSGFGTPNALTSSPYSNASDHNEWSGSTTDDYRTIPTSVQNPPTGNTGAGYYWGQPQISSSPIYPSPGFSPHPAQAAPIYETLPSRSHQLPTRSTAPSSPPPLQMHPQLDPVSSHSYHPTPSTLPYHHTILAPADTRGSFDTNTLLPATKKQRTGGTAFPFQTGSPSGNYARSAHPSENPIHLRPKDTYSAQHQHTEVPFSSSTLFQHGNPRWNSPLYQPPPVEQSRPSYRPEPTSSSSPLTDTMVVPQHLQQLRPRFQNPLAFQASPEFHQMPTIPSSTPLNGHHGIPSGHSPTAYSAFPPTANSRNAAPSNINHPLRPNGAESHVVPQPPPEYDDNPIITKTVSKTGRPLPPVSMFKVKPSKSTPLPQVDPNAPIPPRSKGSNMKMPASLASMVAPGLLDSFDWRKTPTSSSKKKFRIADSPPEGPAKLSDFALQAVLGTGTFGKVHLCLHTPSKQYYCMKVLKKQTIYRFKQMDHIENEKQLLLQLRYPGIVQLFATFNTQDSLMMLMEYVPGGELFFYIRKQGRLSEEVARFYAAELVVTLLHLHERQIVYRDLKPENILLDSTGHLKLADFGFAKRVIDKTWTMCGTPDYLAPEIITGRGHDTAVDWWSLGVLIFEMLVGYPPFTDKDMSMLFRKIQEPERLQIPATISQEAADLIMRLLVVDPSRRLGNLHPDVSDIRTHPWFRPVHWEQIGYRTSPGPIVPVLQSPNEISNFQDHDPQDYPTPPPVPIPEEVQRLFDRF